MSSTIDKSLLSQHWVHSHEEDTPTSMVYRPASYSFPPSRGRDALDLKSDGQILHSGPGPTDRTQQSPGTWSLDDDRLSLQVEAPASTSTGHNILSLDKEKLVLQK